MLVGSVLANITYLQGSRASWKVLKFKKEIFQAWKVMENDCGYEKSWNFTTGGCILYWELPRITHQSSTFHKQSIFVNVDYFQYKIGCIA